MDTTHNVSPLKALGAGMAGSLFALLALLGAQATADQDPTTDQVPRQIPYNGTLIFEGAPVDRSGEQAPWVRFDLSDGVGDGSQVVYSQSMQVDVYQGRFSTMIGEFDDDGTNISNVVLSGEEIYINVTLLGDHDPDNPSAEDDVALSNPQQLALTPAAVWVTNATHFSVGNDLTVSGKATVGTYNGDSGSGVLIENGSIAHTNKMTVGGDLVLDSQLAWNPSNTERGTGTPLAAGDDDTLWINSAQGFSGGTNLGGNLTTTGDIFGGGNLNDTGNSALVNLGLGASGTHKVSFGDDLFLSYEANNNKLIFERSNGNDIFTIFRDTTKPIVHGNLSIGGTLSSNTSNFETLDLRSNNANSSFSIQGGTEGTTIAGANSISITGDLDVDGKLLRTVSLTTPNRSSGSHPSTSWSSEGTSGATTTSQGFCFLSRVMIHKLSSTSDSAGCRVEVDGNNRWVLSAGSAGGTSGADCSSTCVRWR